MKVLSTFRIEKKGDDAIIWERVILNKNYAGKPGVEEFKQANGKIIYYVEKQVKKYSDNVVKT